MSQQRRQRGAGSERREATARTSKKASRPEANSYICLLSHNRNAIVKTIASKDPRAHTANIREGFQEMIQHLREDVKKVDDPKAQALFETAAEVVGGLNTAFQHYETKAEKAWQ
jgi:hypothetical protein